MPQEKHFKIIDESRDKEYFTIVPNYILNHSTKDEQALYLQMKRFAGDGDRGKCFATTTTLAERMKCGEHLVRINIKKLLKRGWIKKDGTVSGKTRPINAYKIVDLWDLNTNFYKKKIPSREPISFKSKKDTVQTTDKIPFGRTIEEELVLKKNTLSKDKGNQVAFLRSYFIEIVKKQKGFEPEMAFGKEGKLLKDKLKRYSADQLKDLIDKFMKSKIGESLGYTLSICLSASVINQWLAGVLEKPKKPTYNGNPMRKMYGKWQVFQNGEWLEFADLDSKIVYI
jgi:hypothetical protein